VDPSPSPSLKNEFWKRKLRLPKIKKHDQAASFSSMDRYAYDLYEPTNSEAGSEVSVEYFLKNSTTEKYRNIVAGTTTDTMTASGEICF
jgi:hypothetical protein